MATSPGLPDPIDRDLARGGIRRSAKLLSVPLGQAGRGALGLGRKLAGADADAVDARLREASAQQLFAVLGDLKGGAMKVGQIMSLMEAALPEEQAAPYREQLRRLQAGAPPMPTSRVNAVMTAEFGPSWRSMFSQFSTRPAAAASIGQVHRGTWAATGEPVAVKIQYPGADEALRSDLAMMERLSRAMQPVAGAMDIKAIAAETAERIGEEVDYGREAEQQERAAVAFDGDDEIVVPHVLAHTGKVIVSQWSEGVGLMTAETWEAERRNEIGYRYARFLFRSAHVSGMLHGDPHPGNFLIRDDGRLTVLDWGLAARMPELPEPMGRLLKCAAVGNAEEMAAGLRAEGFVTRDVDVDALFSYLRPFVEPAAVDEFHFTRAWLRSEMQRIGSGEENTQVMQSLNLPPGYMMLHKVWMGGIAVLSQLDAKAPFAQILDDYLPGWADR